MSFSSSEITNESSAVNECCQNQNSRATIIAQPLESSKVQQHVLWYTVATKVQGLNIVNKEYNLIYKDFIAQYIRLWIELTLQLKAIDVHIKRNI